MSTAAEYEKAIKLLQEQNKELVFITGKLSDELKAADKVIKEQNKRINELEWQIRISPESRPGYPVCRSL